MVSRASELGFFVVLEFTVGAFLAYSNIPEVTFFGFCYTSVRDCVRESSVSCYGDLGLVFIRGRFGNM